jgi:hypothetical protein
MIVVAGIDPSMCGTAVCCGGDIHRFPSTKGGRRIVDQMRRYDRVAGEVMDFLEPLKPSLILIESYSHGSVNRISDMAEFGGILRYNLINITEHIYQVSRAGIIKFFHGKGKIPKGMGKKLLEAAIVRDYDRTFDNDDMMDAWAIREMARVAINNSAVKPHQIESLKTVFKGVDLNKLRSM